VSAEPLVSVVVPTYQSAAFVERTLDSILGQTYRNLEIVIADHGSTDDTWEKLHPYGADPRVQILRTEPGGGAERNWNRVIDQATGPLVKLVCADDLLHPECTAWQVTVMEQHPGVVLVAGKRDLIDASGQVLIRGRGLPGLSGRMRGADAIRATVRAGTNVFGEPACVLMRTDVVRKVGGWSAEQPYLIDEDLYVRVLQHGDFFGISRPVAAFRVSESQWSVHLARKQAGQAVAFHRRLQSDHPGLLSTSDVRIGSLRAIGIAYARRFAYLLWSRRMRRAPAESSSAS
jgi:glycosyltransferase involved in cell wall biosynthesis